MLEPEAVGLLLDFLAGLAFNGLDHTEGRGALSGRLGERVAAPSITLTDAPLSDGTLPRAFDLEGVPKQELALFSGGSRATSCTTATPPRSPAAAPARPVTRRSPAARGGVPRP